ncbi:MAG TPA: PaaI family thioesterase [Acidimicrobiales bacterium]|nr:PaaI family thioesterase [Acidimicrobiales bacterium]
MKDMDRWLGDGGMAIIGAIGGSFEAYGHEPRGWVTGTWRPTDLACNPHGFVQAGVHSILLDGAMNFAINAGLSGRDRTRATLDMRCEYMRMARVGDDLSLRGEVVRLTRQVAYADATVATADGELVSRASAVFLLHREEPPKA